MSGSQSASYVGAPAALRQLHSVNGQPQFVQAIQVPLADTGDAAGDLAAIQNPTSTACVILEAFVNLTTAASAAATVDIGVAADATTSSDTLLDGIDVNTATGVFSIGVNGGSNGKQGQPWGATQYVTASEKTGNTAGLEGTLTVLYIDLAAT